MTKSIANKKKIKLKKKEREIIRVNRWKKYTRNTFSIGKLDRSIHMVGKEIFKARSINKDLIRCFIMIKGSIHQEKQS